MPFVLILKTPPLGFMLESEYVTQREINQAPTIPALMKRTWKKTLKSLIRRSHLLPASQEAPTQHPHDLCEQAKAPQFLLLSFPACFSPPSSYYMKTKLILDLESKPDVSTGFLHKHTSLMLHIKNCKWYHLQLHLWLRNVASHL